MSGCGSSWIRITTSPASSATPARASCRSRSCTTPEVSTLRWIFAIPLATLGVWISALNWVMFWNVFVRHIRQPSWTPLLGGGFAAGAILLMPFNHNVAWAAVPLLLDWGCFPGIGHALWFHLLRKAHDNASRPEDGDEQ